MLGLALRGSLDLLGQPPGQGALGGGRLTPGSTGTLTSHGSPEGNLQSNGNLTHETPYIYLQPARHPAHEVGGSAPILQMRKWRLRARRWQGWIQTQVLIGAQTHQT